MTFYPMHNSPRCGAHARTTGKPCCAPALANGRCRMHGGKSSGAPKGNRHAFKHGGRSAETIELRKAINGLLRGNRQMVRELT